MGKITSPPLNIAISAAEASGDVLAASLVSALKEQTDAHIGGLAGEHMRQSGCQVWWHTNQANVMGFSEILTKLPQLIRLRRSIIKRLTETPCDVFIGVDAPDFNLKIEKKLKQLGIKTIHFVSPSVWAWRSWRVKKIKQSADLVLCLFPFEVDFYRQHQINAFFVGHPLANAIIPRNTYEQNNTLALLPGSRTSEIKQHLDVMLSSVVKLKQDNPKLQVFISLFDDTLVDGVRQKSAPYDWINTSSGNTQKIVAQCDIAIVASGTAALEVALIATPMVVVYKLSWLSYQIAKRLVKTPFVSLPNIIAGKKIVPELIQQTFNTDNVVRHVKNVLAQDYQTIQSEFNDIYRQLNRNSATIAAKEILNHIKKP